MKSIMSQNPCATCTEDRQSGNPYTWQTPCHNCQKKLAWQNAKHDRIRVLESILGDDYDLNRLREMVEADRDGRCVVIPAGGYANKDGEKALKRAMFALSLTNNEKNRYTADAIAEKLSREEAALKGEQDV